MTGADLARLRKAVGLSQIDLAQRAGIGRHAVSYWEIRATVDLAAWAVQRMFTVLPLPGFCNQPEHSRAWAVTAAQQRGQTQRHRVRCAATNRKGTPCRLLSEPGRRRCKFHGGRSTGPRTAKGRARIAEAQRRRWQAWRVKQTPIKPETPETTR